MLTVLLAGAIAMVVALFGTPWYIKFLVKRGYGQFIRDDGPTSHHTKRGTPTMGGAVIIGAVLVGYFGAHLLMYLAGLVGLVESSGSTLSISGLLVLFLTAGLGLVGFADDFTKTNGLLALDKESWTAVATQVVNEKRVDKPVDLTKVMTFEVVEMAYKSGKVTQ